MSTLTNYQTILGSDGKPAFVVLPYADFVKLPGAVRPWHDTQCRGWLGAVRMGPINASSLARIPDADSSRHG